MSPVERLRVLITVKTYPIPSVRYDELVCTAGVNESGDFIRLYPIRFRDLPFSHRYRKYQWIEVDAEKHTGRDTRKESYRPREDTLKICGEPIPTQPDNWAQRARYALAKTSTSMEELHDLQRLDRTSLGVLRPKEIIDLEISRDEEDWKPQFVEALKQQRLWDDRTATREPPRKVPWKFHYRFNCDDNRCTGHKMMIEDWEVGALYLNCIDKGATPEEAAAKVKAKFFDQMCATDQDTHLFVGTVLAHATWVVIGVFWPRREELGPLFSQQG